MKRYRIEVWNSRSETAERVSDTVIKADRDAQAWVYAKRWIEYAGFGREPFDWNLERLTEPMRFIGSTGDCED